jgi:hypothetical protein
MTLLLMLPWWRRLMRRMGLSVRASNSLATSAGVPVVVPREVPVDAVPPRGWFLAAAGAALRVEPDLMVDWG